MKETSLKRMYFILIQNVQNTRTHRNLKYIGGYQELEGGKGRMRNDW